MNDDSYKIIDGIKKIVNTNYDFFEQTEAYKKLPSNYQEEAFSIISIFAELMFAYNDEIPLNWTVKGLKKVCCNIFPRKIAGEKEFFEAIPVVLAGFFDCLSVNKVISIKKCNSLKNKLEKIAPKIVEVSQSKEKWSIGKKLYEVCKEKGCLDERDDDTIKESISVYIGRLSEDELEDLFEMEKREVFQLMVTIKGFKPAIWRRLLVPADITFAKLHNIIQAAFDWLDIGEHSFNGLQNMNRKRLKTYFKDEKKLIYLYDLKDNWQHEIVLEKVLEQALPRAVCIAGARNRPPEEVGGMKGYKEFLKVIKNPNHPEYLNYLRWAEKDAYGRKFDPEYFYITEINRDLAEIEC